MGRIRTEKEGNEGFKPTGTRLIHMVSIVVKDEEDETYSSLYIQGLLGFLFLFKEVSKRMPKESRTVASDNLTWLLSLSLCFFFLRSSITLNLTQINLRS